MGIGKNKYYNVSHLLKDYPDSYYYMAFGERSNGKTYSALEYSLNRYFKHGEQFAYIRRFGEDIKRKTLQNLLSDHMENGVVSKASGGEFSLVNYTSGKFTAYRLEGENDKVVYDIQPMGFAFDLNGMEHYKSTSFPKVTTIIFDEFLSRQGYLPNEFILFMNTLSTIIRDRKNVKIFMLGNTVNRFCPYFTEMGLTHIKDQKPGTIDVYTYADTELSVVVEYCDPMAKKGGKSSDIYFAFDNPQLKMITGGAWEIAIYPHLSKKYRPKDVAFNFFVEFDGSTLHGEIVVTDTDYFMFVHPKTTPIKNEDGDIVYTSEPDERWNYKLGIVNQHDRLSRTITLLMQENRVFYSDNETGEVLRNYMFWSTQYNSVKKR